ncbi:MAG: hypothetical protein CM1200mP39_14370 [Dehalococcoidia bacterium]|nr:MAG: hypothetical protein CM1200mP39_14370 [Dehalococcoidia bacterium]
MGGDETDIVQKEMYSFDDHGGDSITLRPGRNRFCVSSLYRKWLTQSPAASAHVLYGANVSIRKTASWSSRQHHQFGCEIIGDSSPEVDAEIIELGWKYINDLGLKGVTLRLKNPWGPHGQIWLSK